MTTYFIPTANISKIERKLNAIQKRADKLGMDFQFSIGTPEIQKVTVYLPDGSVDLLNSPAFVNCYPVTCTDTQVFIGGYQVVGKIEKVDGVNITFGKVDAQYRNMDNFHCEHCHTNKPAKNLFIVENTETGETMGVGQGCLADYTDRTNALEYVSFFQDIQLLDEMAQDSMSMGGKSDHVLLEKYFYCVMAQYSLNGYVKSGYEKSTKETAFDMYEKTTLTQDQLKEAKSALVQIISYLSEKKPLNTFEWNIFDYLNGIFNAEDDYSPMSVKMAGFVASSILLLQDAKNFKVVGEFVFNVGEKIETELTFVSDRFVYETQYGNMWLYKFVDTNNNVFIWITSNKSEWVGNQLVKKFEEGETYKIRATIKEHNTYGEENQNVLTRVRIVK